MKRPTAKQSKHSSRDANFRLPHDLTPLVREHLNKLESSPRVDYLHEQVFSKFVSKDTAPAIVRKRRAVMKWLATESNNIATNERLMTVDEEYNILPRVTYAQFMSVVRDYVKMVLGDVPPENVLNGMFSGGATTSRLRTESHPARKYLGKAHVTEHARPYGMLALASSPVWSDMLGGLQWTAIEGNVLFTVPKTTDIDRVACKEPDINMYLQKGVGNFIRKRLKLFGIDLNNQSNNQRLAQVGSIDGSYATIDLSSASDSISYELVFQCVPITWFTYLRDLRSDCTLVEGEWHINAMFSSMGNGFTFELESLLFWAIAKAVAKFNRRDRSRILVYGDDIIVPTDIADQLIFALSFLGFTTNEGKTFSSGPFRESCGGHYYLGSDITPFYIRAPIESLSDCIHTANMVRKWSDRGWSILSDELEDLWWALANHVPKCFWGGVDVNDKTRLVSYWRPDRPKVLRPVYADRLDLEGGGYLLWLNSVEHRTLESNDSLVTSVERRDIPGRHLSRRIYSDARWEGGVFLSEVTPLDSESSSEAG